MFVKLIVALIVSVAAFAWQGLSVFSIGVAILAFVIAFVVEGVRVVPQQHAWVVERLGKFHEVLQPGLNVIIPFFDRVAYKHSLKEVPVRRARADLHHEGQHPARRRRHRLLPGDRPAARLVRHLRLPHARSPSSRRRRCARRSARWSSTSRSRAATRSTAQIVSVLDEAGRAWGIKVLRYEVKSLTPPGVDPAGDGEADHRRAREARADREVRGREAAGDQHRRGREAGRDPEVRGREDGADQLGAGRGAPRCGWSRKRPRRRCARSPRRSNARAGSRRRTSRSPSSISARSAISPRPTTR